ncbi:MAG: NADH-quinone oxidoreductase subunit J [Myxococcales bacterium]|jgi:NADH-quinone oxidoreductase subunit J
MTETVFFWIFAVLTVAFAGNVVLRRNPAHAAISLVGAFFFLAGLYVLLAAHLIAILQVMVYAGAVMVLFVFVIMLLNLKEEELGHERITAWKIIGGLSIVITTGLIAFLALGNAYPTGFLRDMARSQPTFGSVKGVGQALYIASVLPFEVTSLLLTVAIVGAVVVAKGKI